MIGCDEIVIPSQVDPTENRCKLHSCHCSFHGNTVLADTSSCHLTGLSSGVQVVVNSLASHLHGTVREFDRSRRLGIIQLDTGQNVTVRYSAIEGQGVRTLKCGDRVTCDIVETQ